MGPNIEPCVYLIKIFEKKLSVSFIFAPCFLRFKYKVIAFSDRYEVLHEVLRQVNHEEYSKEPRRDSKEQYPQNFYCLGFFPVFCKF